LDSAYSGWSWILEAKSLVSGEEDLDVEAETLDSAESGWSWVLEAESSVSVGLVIKGCVESRGGDKVVGRGSCGRLAVIGWVWTEGVTCCWEEWSVEDKFNELNWELGKRTKALLEEAVI